METLTTDANFGYPVPYVIQGTRYADGAALPACSAPRKTQGVSAPSPRGGAVAQLS